MERLLEDKGRAEDALGVEGRRADAEERRSKAWTDQMNELSMQVGMDDEWFILEQFIHIRWCCLRHVAQDTY